MIPFIFQVEFILEVKVARKRELINLQAYVIKYNEGILLHRVAFWMNESIFSFSFIY